MDGKQKRKTEFKRQRKGAETNRRSDTEWEQEGWEATEQDRMVKIKEGRRKKTRRYRVRGEVWSSRLI
jgi:hypothetical protein